MATAAIKVSLVLSLYARVAHSSTALSLALFDDGTNCSSKAAQDNVWNPSPQDATSDGNNCVQSLPLVASSLTVIGIDAGCTVTLYSDQYCSDNATPARLNVCADVGGPNIQSFSVDSCDVPFASSGNASTTATQSLVSTFPESSTTSTSSSNTATTTATSAAAGHSALSPGAKAGVGVGVAAGALFFIAGAVMLWFARRRSRASGASAKNGGSKGPPQELDGTGEIREKMAAAAAAGDREQALFPELPSPAAELESNKDRQELPVVLAMSHGPQELHGSAPYGHN